MKTIKNHIQELEEYHIKANKTLTIILVTPRDNSKRRPQLFTIWQKDSYYSIYDSIESFYNKPEGKGRIFDTEDTYYKNGNGLRKDGYKECIQFLEKYTGE